MTGFILAESKKTEKCSWEKWDEAQTVSLIVKKSEGNVKHLLEVKYFVLTF